MKKTNVPENKTLRSKNILFIEAVYDEYGSNSRVHYLEDGRIHSGLADGTGPRDYIRRMMRTHCLSEGQYRRYMAEWLGLEKGYPYLAGAGALMVPVKTRVSVRLADNRRNYDDTCSFYNFHFFDEDLDLQTRRSCIYLAHDFVIETHQSGAQNEQGYERAKTVLAGMRALWGD
ncbi:hypothetical protein [Eubacterium sp. 1001713B170207_170306_E7]|uniref:hypothetical protein n=1 Tax=Eubacterium sp. 1001713B170207_170306_E7 TaxID=2787097 RepID=UPI00189A71FA|nr:hypothetical protein [Eubacterium sp. 1001713B170207_170306_E7]